MSANSIIRFNMSSSRRFERVVTVVYLLIGLFAFSCLQSRSIRGSVAVDSSLSSGSNKLPNGKTLFVATDEWQTYDPETQILPRGVHVQASVTTGKMTAILVNTGQSREAEQQHSQQEHESEALILVAQSEPDETQSDSPKISVIEKSSGLPQLPVASLNDSRLAPVNETERTARLQQLGRYLTHHSDEVEFVKQLLVLMLSPQANFTEVIAALETLDELIHQIDLACDWAKLGGIDVLVPILQTQTQDVINDANSNQMLDAVELKSELLRLFELQWRAAWVLGSAAQNNPQVKQTALSLGIVKILSDLYRTLMAAQFDNSQQSSLLAADVELLRLLLSVEAKLLYALSAILRDFGRAQQFFHNQHGVELLKQSLEHYSSAAIARSADDSVVAAKRKVLLKTITLIHDFLNDRWLNSEEDIDRRAAETATETQAIVDEINFTQDTDSSSIQLYRQLTSTDMCLVYQTVFARLQLLQQQQAFEGESTGVHASCLVVEEMKSLMNGLQQHSVCTALRHTANQQHTTKTIATQPTDSE